MNGFYLVILALTLAGAYVTTCRATIAMSAPQYMSGSTQPSCRFLAALYDPKQRSRSGVVSRLLRMLHRLLEA